MPRARDPNRDRAFEIWREHGGNITNRQIAEMIGVNEKVVAVWKQRDKWNVVQQSETKVVQQKKSNKGGAPPGNKNAVGNSGGAAPKRNSNAVTHGLFRKYFPEEAAEIMEQIEKRSPIDILWDNIVIQYTAIVRAQQIMFVRDKDDMTKVLKRVKEGDTVTEHEYELQFAWDKQANFLQAQSRAMATLQSMITRYEELCRSDLATEEQRLRIEKLKAEVKALGTGSEDKELHIIVDYGEDAHGDGPSAI
jgi:uncharacterized protein YjcR